MVSKKAKVARPTSVKKSKNNKRAIGEVNDTALKVSGLTTRQKGYTLSAGKRKQAGRDARNAQKKG